MPKRHMAAEGSRRRIAMHGVPGDGGRGGGHGGVYHTRQCMWAHLPSCHLLGQCRHLIPPVMMPCERLQAWVPETESAHTRSRSRPCTAASGCRQLCRPLLALQLKQACLLPTWVQYHGLRVRRCMTKALASTRICCITRDLSSLADLMQKSAAKCKDETVAVLTLHM